MCTPSNTLIYVYSFRISDAYLEDLTDYFEDLGETLELSPSFHIDSYDVLYSSGVLTLQLGPSLGTFVINKQPPNKQIWLSSPISYVSPIIFNAHLFMNRGPKRYDYTTDNQWRYVRDASRLKDLLDSELSKLLKINVQVP